MDDLLSEFLTETSESVGTLDVEVVKLEQNPNDPELLGNIFRLMHTIKGTCGFLGLPRLESVAHAGENILGKVRDGDIEATPAAVSLILECLDKIREILATLEATESEPEGNDKDLIDRLNAVADGTSGDTAEAPAPDFEELAAEESAVDSVDEPDEAAAPENAPELATEAEAPEPEPAAVAAPPKAAASKAADAPEAVAPKDSAVAAQSIRVNVDVLENLMTMVSELVLTRNQLLQIMRGQKESDFAAPLQQLNHVVSELQDGVMQTRMQPIGNAWAKLPRIVRDLSHELNKKIDLVMVGKDTELDRQVLELIKDPLTHMVRNSGDHGLEIPEERIKAGKKEIGTIKLDAFHEGGHIIIEITDDGRGLPMDKIKQKILDNGLSTEAELESLSDQQIQQFIFKAGFSTAAKVTSVSGRGVGMDVVRTNIEKIGGTVGLTSTEGQGSRFTIKIPLTLAIVNALIVECCKERFAIPQLSVVELVRASANSEHTIERINGTPVLRLRNRLLPLINLRELLKLESPDAGEATDVEQGEVSSSGADDGSGMHGFIVVAKVGTYSFGIIVDRVFDTEEIVVKPVAPILRHISLFSGNTILGDGSVVMILDPNGVSAATGEISVGESPTATEAEQKVARGEERVAMLVFRSGDQAPKAVPLALIARLEDIDLEKVEFSNGQHVVQYRGQLMPLVIMEGGNGLKEEGRQPVLVFNDQDRTMGLVVDEIVDIVEDYMKIELSADRAGYVGSAVVAGKATDIVDAGYFLTQAFPDWFGAQGESSGENSSRVLLVDDSPFFRNLLTPLLRVAGYDVVTVESPDQALGLCDSGENFDLIISDIEMPGMSGFDFAETVRDNTRWTKTPMIALSSNTSQEDLERGRTAGFVDYVAKNDRDGLLHTMRQTLSEYRGAA